MQKYVCKFGGTSLADAEHFKKVKDIVLSRSLRKYIVASAPGRRFEGDPKVTDMLSELYNAAAEGADTEAILSSVGTRFSDIIDTLGISFDLRDEIGIISRELKNNPSYDYILSRGEYLNARILAEYLGFPFIDARDLIRFTSDGTLDTEATDLAAGSKLGIYEYAVIPGFYGADPEGGIRIFSRGGSDITGAIIARAVMADMYENWTDVSGMLTADPRIVDNPIPISAITYRELRELSYMGATVMHESAVFPVRKANITMNIRNTDSPDDPGTLISAEMPRVPRKYKVAGIAGQKGFSAVLVETPSMNDQVGFGAKLLNIFARHDVSFEHLPSGIDTISVVLKTSELDKARDEIVDDIINEISPEHIFVEDDIALIAVVGMGMAYSRGTAARITRALADSRVNIRMIDQGSTEINIIFGVDEADYETAIRSIYNAIYT